MTIANVRYITNGYIVGANVPAAPTLQSIYAGTIPEVVYWLGRIFDPITGVSTLASKADTHRAGIAREDIVREIDRLTALQEQLREPEPDLQLIQPADDPLLGQRANVETIASGGFLVTQLPSTPGNAQMVEVYCVDMDAVSATLSQIFAPPDPVVPEADPQTDRFDEIRRE